MIRFIKSVFDVKNLDFNDKPEVCVIGRSNVGKSTLINSFAKAKVAFVAKKSGKTRSLNYYDFDKFNLVDLPGYGFAAVDQTQIKKISVLISEYFASRSNINGVIHLCDIEHFNDKDLDVFNKFTKNYENYLICLNKADRYSNQQQKNFFKKASAYFKISEDKILLISGKTKFNIDKLNSIIIKWIKK